MDKKPQDETFFVRGEIYSNDGAIPVTIEGTYSEYDPEPVVCRILPDQDTAPLGNFHIKEEGIHRLQLRGQKYPGYHIWIPSLRLQNSFSGIAELFVEGNLSDLSEPRGTAYCHLTLPYTALVRLEKDRIIGAHELRRDQEPTGITWNTPIGKAELVRNYDYSTETRGEDETHIETLLCDIQIEVHPENFTSIQDLVHKLWHSQDEVIWLLSFLSKKRLAWHRGSIFYKPPTEGIEGFRAIHLRREAHLNLTRRHPERRTFSEDLLVDPQSLKNGIFEHMVAVYENSPYRETLLRVIQNSMATYDEFYFEAHYGIIWTALEMLVDSIGHEFSEILREKEFRSLKGEILALIQQRLVGNPQEIEDIKAKLPELQRRAFVSKLRLLLDRNEIDYRQLWPKSSEDINEELKKLHSRRNHFVHRGKIDDFFLNLQDMRRIRYLINLWILKLLEFPVSELAAQHDSDLWYAQRLKSELDF